MSSIGNLARNAARPSFHQSSADNGVLIITSARITLCLPSPSICSALAPLAPCARMMARVAMSPLEPVDCGCGRAMICGRAPASGHDLRCGRRRQLQRRGVPTRLAQAKTQRSDRVEARRRCRSGRAAGSVRRADRHAAGPEKGVEGPSAVSSRTVHPRRRSDCRRQPGRRLPDDHMRSRAQCEHHPM